MTQSFFERFLERGYFALADPERGSFRTFLLTCLKRFLVEEWRRANRQKRGGGQALIRFAAEDAEGRYGAALTELSPDRLCDRHWAEALLERVMARLGQDYASTGRMAVFTHVSGWALSAVSPRAMARPWPGSKSPRALAMPSASGFFPMAGVSPSSGAMAASTSSNPTPSATA